MGSSPLVHDSETQRWVSREQTCEQLPTSSRAAAFGLASGSSCERINGRVISVVHCELGLLMACPILMTEAGRGAMALEAKEDGVHKAFDVQRGMQWGTVAAGPNRVQTKKEGPASKP
ncbi:hypothetical protein PSPO01_11303 [Paraphaeosphaeria sporulosa]